MDDLYLKQKLTPRYLYSKRKKLLPYLCNILKRWIWNSKLFRYHRENSINYQRRYWTDELFESNSNAAKHCAYRLDAPDCQDDRLGNYEKIKFDYLLPNIDGARVLEIGCLGGKWSKYFFRKASEVILVDLDRRIGTFLRDKFPTEKFRFYETKGYELYGIGENSVDFIFSMDSLGRCPKKYIKKYFREFGRVLATNGRMMIHLPCMESPVSVEKGFTKLSKKDIKKACNKNGFSSFELDFDTIVHGVLLKVNFN